jgi:uncharacterized protein
MSYANAKGAPIAAFASVAAWLHNPETVATVYGGAESVRQRKQVGEAAIKLHKDMGVVCHVPAYSATDPKAGMGKAVGDYYSNPATVAVLGGPIGWLSSTGRDGWVTMAWRERRKLKFRP